MDCCICSPMASVYRPPRNTICQKCYQASRGMLSLLKEVDGVDQKDTTPRNSHGLRVPTISKGISDALKKMEEMKEMEERMNGRLSFVDELVAALKEGLHTDILVQPGSGPPIPAHKVFLAKRSEIFRNMFTSDECKAPTEDIISLPELSYDELQCFLEFLYCGTLQPEKRAEKHACSLLIAADKYDVPFLRNFCEDCILRSLSPSNALKILEVADICSSTRLKEQAMDSIIKHVEEVLLSKAYDSFALKNAHLSVEITRALLMDMKAKKDMISCLTETD